MMSAIRKRKCLHCKNFYRPDPRSLQRQKFCSKQDCKKASKKASQRRWLAKKENKDYFKGPENVARVQRWRKRHPGYWRRIPTVNENALQDECSAQPANSQEIIDDIIPVALQDVSLSQSALLVGLIAKLSGFALQDEIAEFIRNIQAYGQCILGMGPGMNLEEVIHDCKKSVMPATVATCAGAV